MECVYDIFNFLSEEPIEDAIHGLRESCARRFELGLKKVEQYTKEENEERREHFLAITIKNATVMRLCDFFILTKENHDVEIVIQDLLMLGKQEKSLVKKEEFEAAKLKSIEFIKIREYLNNKNQNVSTITEEESLINILRPCEAHRAPVQG